MTFLVWVYKSQDFTQTQQNIARSHDRETVTLRNSETYFRVEKSTLVSGCTG